MRRLLELENTPGEMLKVEVSDLAKQLSNGKQVLQLPKTTTEELKKELGPEKAALLTERIEVEAQRLMNKEGVRPRSLPKPSRPIIKLIDPDKKEDGLA